MMDCPAVAPESVFSFMVFLFLPVQVHMQQNYVANLPTQITALSGSCVQIPCTFAPEDKLKNTNTIFGCWIKKNSAFLKTDSLVVFNGSTNIIKGFNHIEILGNLSQRECTTVFYDVMNNHTDNYYFRVEMKNPEEWKWTYAENPVYISVSHVPQPPILTPTHLQPVMEKTTVNLSCSAEAPCPKQPPTISWSKIPKSANITTQLKENPNKTQSVFSHVTFKASYMDNTKNISCTATYPRNTSNDSTVVTTMILRVLFSPKETHITVDPSDSVSVGTNVTLTCKSKANPNEMNYTWYKRGQEKKLDFGDKLTFNVDRTSGGWYFCTAENIHGTQTSEEIQLIVEKSQNKSLIIGCVGGISAFLLIFLLVTIFLRVQRVKASIIRETDVSDQGQEKHVQVNHIYHNSALTGAELEMPNDENDIHYGQIDFSTAQNKNATEKISGQETIYAEVHVSEKD
ncbi:B-cell receptor CD22-like [Labeo rohita]|uniref:B-cell receptor CD22-like n=1 Tax=Labeo rohita TaxID=84645 RepID=UPI0021E26BE4|nr:B-cell receptor CD22-like [Labeo rohita]